VYVVVVRALSRRFGRSRAKGAALLSAALVDAVGVAQTFLLG
jgi:hypothetical protein